MMTRDLNFADGHAEAQRDPGVTLFTISIVTSDGNYVTRAYSSHEDIYPLDGLKPAGHPDADAQTAYHPDRASIERVFAEKDLIISTGSTAGINVPLWHEGAFIGAVNFFHGEDIYTVDSVAHAEAVADRLRPAILAYRATHSSPHSAV